MPPVQAHIDHCKTAEDVLATAQAVRARREASWMKPVRRLPTPKRPEPVKAAPPVQFSVAESVFPSVTGAGIAHFINLMGPAQANPISPAAAPKPSIKSIQMAVCTAADVSLDDMLSPRRLKHIVRARHVAMMLCKRLTQRSFPEIGRRFGGRDHTTVLHGVLKMEPVLAEIEPAIAAGSSLGELAVVACEAFDRIQPAYPRSGAA